MEQDMTNLNINNPYLQQIIHHKHKLQTSDKYQAIIQSKNLIIELEKKEKEKYLKQYQSLKLDVEVLIKQHQSEMERLMEMKEVEIVRYKAEVNKYRVMVEKEKQGNREEKELRRENQRKTKLLQDYLKELQERDKKITKLKDQKQQYWSQLNHIKRQNKNQLTKDIKDKELIKKLELENQQINHRIKLLKQQLNQQIQVRERKAQKYDELSHQHQNVKQEYINIIRDMQLGKKELEQKCIQMQKQLALERKDVEYLKRQIQKKDQKQPKSEPNRKRNIVYQKRKYEQEDPEELSIQKQQHSSINIPDRSKNGRTIRDNSRVNERIKQIPLRLSPEHHCLCMRSEKYKNRLKQANEKIVQLLAEKCRRGIQMSFNTKTSKRYGNTTFDI